MTAARADYVNESPPDATLATTARPDPTIAGRAPTSADPEPASVTDLTAVIAARQIAAQEIIDEAKRLLMAHGNLTEPEAHRWIQKTAMDRRAPKQLIALGIIEALSEKT